MTEERRQKDLCDAELTLSKQPNRRSQTSNQSIQETDDKSKSADTNDSNLKQDDGWMSQMQLVDETRLYNLVSK